MDFLAAIRSGEGEVRRVEEAYTISEGDTSNYWEQTAANAIRALKSIVSMLISCISEGSNYHDAEVWGD